MFSPFLCFNMPFMLLFVHFHSYQVHPCSCIYVSARFLLYFYFLSLLFVIVFIHSLIAFVKRIESHRMWCQVIGHCIDPKIAKQTIVWLNTYDCPFLLFEQLSLIPIADAHNSLFAVMRHLCQYIFLSKRKYIFSIMSIVYFTFFLFQFISMALHQFQIE